MPCNRVPCTQSCNESAFGTWTTCDSYCGDGLSTRRRTVFAPDKNGGTACGPVKEFRACTSTAGACPADCSWTNWTDWSNCSHTCGGGTKTRTRKQTAGMRGACGTLEENAPCGELPCPQNCVVSPWSTWSNCTLSCGASGGTMVRERSVLKNALYGGTKCPSLLETKTCNVGVPC